MLEECHGKTYVLAISGGPDSMALLHMAVMDNIDVVVCHVNYHRRNSSDRDEVIVRSFCRIHDIPCYVRHAGTTYEGNFQDYARNFRYSFFQEIYQQYQADGLMSAHHLDDHLETAMLRHKQGRNVGYYGIKNRVVIYGMYVIRPLLSLWKTDLYAYCDKHGIVYGEDESNQSDAYARNRIRHELNQRYDEEQKLGLLAFFTQENERLEEERVTCNFILNQLEYKEQLPVALLLASKNKELLLRMWLSSNHDMGHRLREAQIKQILRLGTHQKGHKEVPLFDSYFVIRTYDALIFQKKQEMASSFQVILPSIKEMDTQWFKVRLSGNLKDGITVGEDDFPLVIRSALPGDRIHFSFGHKKLSRLFIDLKIPLEQRKHWPVVCNHRNEVIFVCGWGSSYEYFTNTPNLFVVK